MSLASTPKSATSKSTAARLSYETLAWLLGDSTRWRIFEVLAEGEPQMVKMLSMRVGKAATLVQKHLVVMRKAGVVVVGQGRLNQLAPAYRPEPGSREIDLGACVLRLGAKSD